jgi:hypothetical protein
MTLEAMKQAVPQFIHKCPYVGIVAGKNLKLIRQFTTMHPSGVFKLNLTMTDGENDLLRILYDYELKD